MTEPERKMQSILCAECGWFVELSVRIDEDAALILEERLAEHQEKRHGETVDPGDPPGARAATD